MVMRRPWGRRQPRCRERPSRRPCSSKTCRASRRRPIAAAATKDHILESGGSGVAMFDYDGDGPLDIYLVTAFELSDAREKIPHRNALYRNEGGWTFRDVSAGSGLDVAAWGNGVCTGDYDNDGRLDLYVTNFGPNFLFRNNGNGTFTDVAPDAAWPRCLRSRTSSTCRASARSSWSTGCTFFDADGDGDLDLYVARLRLDASWSELARAQRTLVWRGGPKTMIGPMGLPGEADLFFENRRERDRSSRPPPPAGSPTTPGAMALACSRPTMTRMAGSISFVANDTTPEFPVPQSR